MASTMVGWAPVWTWDSMAVPWGVRPGAGEPDQGAGLGGARLLGRALPLGPAVPPGEPLGRGRAAQRAGPRSNTHPAPNQSVRTPLVQPSSPGPGWHRLEVTDPIRQFNDYGYTMCSTIAGINCAIWDAMGLKAKYWDISLHTVPEVEYDGR